MTTLYKFYKVFIFLIFSSLILSVLYLNKDNLKDSYWIWAGIRVKDAPKNAPLYIFQGHFYKNIYLKQGIFPYPLNSEIKFLVYRLNGFPDSKVLVDQFHKTVKRWEKHKAYVEGLQIDFDSSTHQLRLYSDF